MDADRLQDTLAKFEARGRKHQQGHQADIAHVQQHHPELAAWLTEMRKAFGPMDYRVTLRCDTGDEYEPKTV